MRQSLLTAILLATAVTGVAAGWAYVSTRQAQATGTMEVNAWYKDTQRISAGSKVFMANCSGCHGALGEGEVGPNLTDDYWLHGGSAEAILATVTQGVQDKGMPRWEGTLSEDEIRSAAAYVFSLKGTNVADGKAPQGAMEAAN